MSTGTPSGWFQKDVLEENQLRLESVHVVIVQTVCSSPFIAQAPGAMQVAWLNAVCSQSLEVTEAVLKECTPSIVLFLYGHAERVSEMDSSFILARLILR